MSFSFLFALRLKTVCIMLLKLLYVIFLSLIGALYVVFLSDKVLKLKTWSFEKLYLYNFYNLELKRLSLFPDYVLNDTHVT